MSTPTNNDMNDPEYLAVLLEVELCELDDRGEVGNAVSGLLIPAMRLQTFFSADSFTPEQALWAAKRLFPWAKYLGQEGNGDWFARERRPARVGDEWLAAGKVAYLGEDIDYDGRPENSLITLEKDAPQTIEQDGRTYRLVVEANHD